MERAVDIDRSWEEWGMCWKNRLGEWGEMFFVAVGRTTGSKTANLGISLFSSVPFVASLPGSSMNVELPPGGILLGLGCDIIDVDRVRGVLERQGERFRNRVFTAEEQAYCESLTHPHKHYAARFAAKEAVSKCFTTGIGAEFGWKSASVYHGERQQPLIRLDESGDALLRRLGGTHVVVSLSHTATAAMAVAAIVKSPTS